MRLSFAEAVDPIFQAALTLFEKIEANTDCHPAQEHALILNLFDQADMLLGDAQQWQLARYALAVWVDEIVLTTPWDGSNWWRNHILEMELFHTRICSIHFFELAKEASGLPCRDALEVFYNCVVLGFRGMYANADFEIRATQEQQWPKTIEQWLSRTLRMIDVAPGFQMPDGVQRAIVGAPPLNGRKRLVWWTVAATVLLLVNGALFQFLQSSK